MGILSSRAQDKAPRSGPFWQSGSDGRCHRHQESCKRHKPMRGADAAPNGSQSIRDHRFASFSPFGQVHFGNCICHAFHSPLVRLGKHRFVCSFRRLADFGRIRGAIADKSSATNLTDAAVNPAQSSRNQWGGATPDVESGDDASYGTIKQRKGPRFATGQSPSACGEVARHLCSCV